MDAIGSVSGAPCAPPIASQVTSTEMSSAVATTSASSSRVGGAAGLGESLAALAGAGHAEDAMKLLVAMLLLDALFGDEKSGKDGKLEGALALSMLGQAATSGVMTIENSFSMMVSQQSATSAYSQTATVSSMNLTG